jgi:hypothetical protein
MPTNTSFAFLAINRRPRCASSMQTDNVFGDPESIPGMVAGESPSRDWGFPDPDGRPSRRAAPPFALDQAIARLARAESDAFLRRLAKGEPALSSKLNRRLRELLVPPMPLRRQCHGVPGVATPIMLQQK